MMNGMTQLFIVTIFILLAFNIALGIVGLPDEDDRF
jgi:hypothetical protein